MCRARTVINSLWKTLEGYLHDVEAVRLISILLACYIELWIRYLKNIEDGKKHTHAGSPSVSGTYICCLPVTGLFLQVTLFLSSTLSSSMSAMAAVSWKHFFEKPFLHLSEDRKSFITKILGISHLCSYYICHYIAFVHCTICPPVPSTTITGIYCCCYYWLLLKQQQQQ